MTKDDIAKAVRDRFEAVAVWFDSQPDDAFHTGPDAKWTAAQHLDHLIRSAAPLNKALRLPRFIPGLLFGKSDGTSRDYDGVVALYKNALADGGQAHGPYVPADSTTLDKSDLLERFRREKDRLASVVESWDEAALDAYRLPHPLMGKLTVREMLYFTLFHTEYHGDILKTRH